MKDETQDRMDNTASQFRQVAGLPERKNDKPHDVSKPSQLRRQAEPDGGYDQRGETEVDERTGQVDEKVVEEMQAAEELSAKSGEGTNSPIDAGTSTDATEKAAAKGGSPAAKKAAKAKDNPTSSTSTAKKSTAKKTAAKKTTAKGK